MKYIDADHLREEIEKRFWDYGTPLHDDEVTKKVDEILNIIDSLQQEKPEVDLKKEIKEWVDLMVGASFPEQQDGDFISKEDYRSVIRQTAIHFLCLNAEKEE